MVAPKAIQWQTNKIKFEEKDGKKFVIKSFSTVKPALIFALYNIAYFLNSTSKLALKNEYYFPSVKKRIENEIRGRKVLSYLGFKTPRIYWYDEKSICMESVDGEKLSDFYRTKEIKITEEISKRIGWRVRKIHDSGFALIDCRNENYVIKNNEIYNLDLEFFTKASEFQKMCDIVTYDASALNLKPEKCKAVIKAFHDGYGKNLTRDEIIYIMLFSLIFPFSLKENFIELANRNFNLYMLVKDF